VAKRHDDSRNVENEKTHTWKRSLAQKKKKTGWFFSSHASVFVGFSLFSSSYFLENNNNNNNNNNNE
jgi:hypothetical protein